MSFKLHLIIICFIIVSVYAVWRFMDHSPAPAPAPVIKESPYSISIVHASWALNCRNWSNTGQYSNAQSNDPFAKSNSETNKNREDNVLEAVSNLCNGQLRCDIPANIETLGDQPFPNCLDRALEVEYRCYSFDRPWKQRVMGGTMTINCDRPVE